MSGKVALVSTINEVGVQAFGEAGFEVASFPNKISAEDLVAETSDAVVIGVRTSPRVPAEVIDAATGLEAIGVYSVGYEKVDVDTASEKGVAVFNSVFENTRSVAELVIGDIFSLFRRVQEHNRAMHEGTWTKTDEKSFEVRGKTLGIVGYGSIGSQASVLAEAVGLKVAYYDPAPKSPAYGNAKRVKNLDALLAEADILTLHVPGVPATENMINERTLAKMKKGSYLINTARGEIVDYEAVRDALDSWQLAGVAIDVFVGDDQYAKGDEFDHILRGHPRVLFTPHIGGATQEAQQEIARETSQKVIGYLTTGSTVGSVNFPEFDLSPDISGQARLLYIHRNTPGALALLTSVIANHSLNIGPQRSEGKDGLAYAVADVEGSISDDAVAELKANKEHTIKVRVINRAA